MVFIFIQQILISIILWNGGAARPQDRFFLGVSDSPLSWFAVFNKSRGVAMNDLCRSKVSAKQIIMGHMSGHDAKIKA